MTTSRRRRFGLPTNGRRLINHDTFPQTSLEFGTLGIAPPDVPGATPGHYFHNQGVANWTRGLAPVSRLVRFDSSHLRLPGSGEATDGWITSAGALSTEGTPVAMAMLRAGRNQMNQIVSVHNGGRVVTSARVVMPMFYDPSGARMNA